MFKFKIGDHVSFVYGSVFSPNPDGVYQAVVNGGKIIARKDYGSGRGPEYRVAGFSGWWAEENFVLVHGGFKNPSSREEASSPCTLQGEESKCDTGDSGASGNSLYYQGIYLEALKKTYGKVPFESETVEVGSLLEFTKAILEASKEVRDEN